MLDACNNKYEMQTIMYTLAGAPAFGGLNCYNLSYASVHHAVASYGIGVSEFVNMVALATNLQTISLLSFRLTRSGAAILNNRKR